MIIIPEIETVVILVPRTGSGSLRRCIAATYPRAIQLYRHMEADGVPQGYDRWRKVGVVRDPVDRLWSLYKFLGRLEHGNHEPEYVARMRASVSGGDFSEWLLRNETVFTDAYGSTRMGIDPFYSCRHNLAENRKSQFIYLRPDLGTEVYSFEHGRDKLAADLGLPRLSEFHANATAGVQPPRLSERASDHLYRFFSWDIHASAHRAFRIPESVDRNRFEVRPS